MCQLLSIEGLVWSLVPGGAFGWISVWQRTTVKLKGDGFFFFPSKVEELTLRNVSQERLQRQIPFCFLHYGQMWDGSAEADCCCCIFSHRGATRSFGPLDNSIKIDICGPWYVPGLLRSTRFPQTVKVPSGKQYAWVHTVWDNDKAKDIYSKLDRKDIFIFST